jgi:hypothetical protein|tara:strand:+ start:621 stop:821 length:201 start_codon:yes stop_codon:yes gene_type:complete
MNKVEISCWNCKFFAISWDANYRYQCKQMGFKSNTLPSEQVKIIDNRECLAFKAKTGKKSSPTGRR